MNTIASNRVYLIEHLKDVYTFCICQYVLCSAGRLYSRLICMVVWSSDNVKAETLLLRQRSLCYSVCQPIRLIAGALQLLT